MFITGVKCFTLKLVFLLTYWSNESVGLCCKPVHFALWMFFGDDD